MKKLILINGLAVIFTMMSSNFAAAEESPAKASEDMKSEANVPDKLKHNMGYFFGYSFGNMLKQGGNEDVDMEALQKGMQDSLANKVPDMTRDEQQAVIEVLQAQRKKRMDEQREAQKQAEAQQTADAKKNLEAAMAFMKDNAKKPGIKVTASGLQYEVIKKGTGKSPKAGDRVRVDYEGRLTDGQIFDSSKKRGQPAEFGLNQVIPGWTEGLQLMKEGGSSRFFIPPDLAYGPGGTHGIPPNSVLIFDVDLLKVNPEPAASKD